MTSEVESKKPNENDLDSDDKSSTPIDLDEDSLDFLRELLGDSASQDEIQEFVEYCIEEKSLDFLEQSLGRKLSQDEIQQLAKFLSRGTDPNVTDRGGKTPENQEDLPTCGDEEICELRNGSGQEVSHKSNENSEEGPSNSSGNSCSSGKDSLSMLEKIPLYEGEEELMDEFYEEMTGGLKDKHDQKSALVYIKDITDKYLRKGIRLNVRYGNHDKTVTDSIFEEMKRIISQYQPSSTATCNSGSSCEGDEKRASKTVIQEITGSLFLEGGSIEKKFIKELENDYYDSDYVDNLNKQYNKRWKELEDAAYEGIFKDRQAQKGKLEASEMIDNGYFYMKYSQDSVVNPAKILTSEKAKVLRVGIIRIGESIVNVEKGEGGKRNYKDVLEGGIELSFTTEAGKINIYLYRIEGNSDEVKVDFADDESKKRFHDLVEEDKSNLGKNCRLGGKSVSQAITDKCFKRNAVELDETAKDIPSAVLNQVKQENHNLSLSLTQTPN
ncbi:hypothetical protein [Candidatus Wolbachia massiliensis]|uniref:Ankyrin repeat domain protein n=1 Tax=Candidatus Wolbachia massiliensis TaxID=1845000 RepID=A0A7L7YRH6_9RICK|nr:hypothetical protein [Candidatus Wolbachia massiliensis]QOD38346.1 hypothetical protein ID128_00180 [Candidatus Wolbachia massiliensis]